VFPAAKDQNIQPDNKSSPTAKSTARKTAKVTKKASRSNRRLAWWVIIRDSPSLYKGSVWVVYGSRRNANLYAFVYIGLAFSLEKLVGIWAAVLGAVTDRSRVVASRTRCSFYFGRLVTFGLYNPKALLFGWANTGLPKTRIKAPTGLRICIKLIIVGSRARRRALRDKAVFLVLADKAERFSTMIDLYSIFGWARNLQSLFRIRICSVVWCSYPLWLSTLSSFVLRVLHQSWNRAYEYASSRRTRRVTDSCRHAVRMCIYCHNQNRFLVLSWA